MFGVGTAPAWLSRALYAADAPSPRKKVLVAIFQRGAVDGLNMVVPFGETSYYKLRPNLAIPKPDRTENSAVDLDGFFGLHPALAPLKPIYDAGHMAIVQAVGSPDPTRSHFDAQDYMESGTPGRKATSDGWLNRALNSQGRENVPSPVRAVSLGATLPRALRGQNEAVAIANVNDFQVKDARGAGTFESMYENSLDQVLNGAGRETFEAVKLMQSIQKQPYAPENGVEYPKSALAQDLMQIARLIKSNVGLEVAFAEMRGWDTHVNQVGAQDLGDRMADVSVVTMSEFGRTARENGSRGTDHGHANVMFAFGGGIRGGKVHGEWPGLEPEQLYEQRDLQLTTDFRDVLGELVVRHLGNSRVASVFPGYERPKFRGIVAG
jgi:uncharacterized protein (DUF1501 family)